MTISNQHAIAREETQIDKIEADLAAEGVLDYVAEAMDRQEVLRKAIVVALDAKAIEYTGKSDVYFSLGWLSGAVASLLDGDPDAMKLLRNLLKPIKHTGA